VSNLLESKMLWLALNFPLLPLEVYTRGSPDEGPFAVADSHGSRHWMLAANAAAHARGVHPGMALGAAHALVHELRVRPRDPAAERSALEGIAAWAGRYTPAVSLEPPQALLLELQGSLTLFGGLDALLGAIEAGITELGYCACSALAPTPTAALLLARAERALRIADAEALACALAEIELRHLELPQETLETLHEMGVRRIGECLRLPRAGLARRFGPGLLDLLDRAHGRIPDPRLPYQPPPHFAARLALPAEVESTDALVFAARRMVLELTGYLQARGAGVQGLELLLLHRDGQSTSLHVGLVAPSRDARHLLALLRERLERLELPAPVLELGLHAEEIRPLDGEELELFGKPAHPGKDWPLLVERLCARLGADAVRGLCPVPEHRPERAWKPCPPGARGPSPRFAGVRPLWLLTRPAPLVCTEGRPRLAGELVLEHGPEIIEAGWWDGADIARDYYIARNPGGGRFWVYRERCGGGGWFLHGVFG
jgi:protein ImuB